MSSNSVVLPAPFGPIKPKVSPRATASETLSTAVTDPNDLVTELTTSNWSVSSPPLRSIRVVPISPVSSTTAAGSSSGSTSSRAVAGSIPCHRATWSMTLARVDARSPHRPRGCSRTRISQAAFRPANADSSSSKNPGIPTRYAAPRRGPVSSERPPMTATDTTLMLSLGVNNARVTKLLAKASTEPPRPATNPENPYASSVVRRGAMRKTRAAFALSRRATNDLPNAEPLTMLANARIDTKAPSAT